MSNFRIGAPKIGSGRVARDKYLRIQPGDNFYRVMPPVFAMADSGEWSKFYRTHRVKTADGHTRTFCCAEDKDNKTKMIKTHCPFCDHVEDAKKYLAQIVAQGATKEQIKEFEAQNIDPFKSDMAIYVNAMTEGGAMSVLPIKYKLFQTILSLQKKVYDEQQLNFVDVQGAFLNIKKIQAYKGDRDTSYSADLAMIKTVVNGKAIYEVMYHELSNEQINEYEKKAYDLNALFKTITIQEIQALLESEGTERQALIDRIWSKPEHEEKEENTAMQAKIGGTNAVAVSRVDISSGRPELITPGFAPKTTPKEEVVDAIPEFKSAPVAAPAPVSAPIAAANASPFANYKFGAKPATPTPATLSNLSETDFVSAFKSQRGK